MQDHFQENDILFLMAVGMLIMIALALAVVVLFNRYQSRLLKEQNQRQVLQLSHQKALLHGTILTQENERKRIAKDLHDEIGSKLNVLLLNMHRLKKVVAEPDQLDQALLDIRTLIHSAIDTTRRISHELLPPVLEDFGLGEALKELGESYQQSGMIDIEISVNGQANGSRDKMMEVNIFRVVQELVSNSIRHGKARKVTIALEEEPSYLILEYQDDGMGFDLEKVEKKGLGLRNMESRIHMFNGELAIKSAPGEGVWVEIKKVKNQETN